MPPTPQSAPQNVVRRFGKAMLALIGASSMLIGIALLIIGWLLLSPASTQMVIDLAQRTSAGRLSVVGASGRLLGPLRIDQLRWQDARFDLQLDDVTLDIAAAHLLSGQLRIDTATARALTLSLKPAVERKAPDPERPALPQRAPIETQIEQLQLTQLRIVDARGQPLTVIDDLQLRGRWTDAALRIDELRVDLQSPALGTLRAEGEARMDGRGLDIDRLQISGPGQLDLQGRWNLRDASELKLQWQGLRWPFVGDSVWLISDGNGRLTGALAAPQFELSARAGAQARIEARLQLGDALSGRIEWTDLGWPLNGQAPLLTSPQGGADISGRTDQWQALIDADLDYPLPEALVTPTSNSLQGQLQARLQGSLRAATFDSAQLQTLGGTVSGSGQIDWRDRRQAEISGSFRQLNPGAQWSALQSALNGRYALQVDFADRTQTRLQVHLGESRWLGRRFAADLDSTLASGAVRVDKADVRSGATRLQLQGQLWPQLDLHSVLQSPQLGDLWPTASGALQLKLAVSGPPQRSRIQLEASGQHLRYAGIQVGRLELTSAIDSDRGPLDLQLGADQLVAGLRLDRLDIGVHGSSDSHRIDARLRNNGLLATLQLQGALATPAWRWSGLLNGAELQLADSAPWTLDQAAALVIDRSLQRLAQACWSSAAGHVCADATRNGQRLQAQLDSAGVDLPWLIPLLPPGWRIDGQLSGTAGLQMTGSTLNHAAIQLASSAGTLTDPRGQRLAFAPSSLRISGDAELAHAHLQLAFADGELQADAALGRGDVLMLRPLSGSVRADLAQLNWLPQLSPEIAESSGRLRADTQLSGNLGNPRLLGELRIEDGRIRLQRPAIVLQDMTLRIDGEPEGLHLEGGLSSGGGRLDVQGLYHGGGVLDLQLRGKNFLAVDLPEAEVRASPDLQLRLDPERLRISGTIELPQAEIRPKGGESGVAASRDQVVIRDTPEPTGGTRSLLADIRVSLGDKVNFSGYGLKAGITGAIDVHEESGRPTRGSGELRVTQGRYTAYGQDLDIKTGRLLFAGEAIDRPAIEVRAERRPTDDIMVGVQVRGTLDQPEFSLYSDPTMNQQEQLSWLLLGRSLENAGSSSERSMVAGAALSLGLSGSSRLLQSFKGDLGLDDISIGAEPGQDSSKAMFTVGKYLSPGLYVSYGVGLFEQGYQLKMLYDLGSGFKLSTESGVDTGADILYSVEH